MTWLDLNNHASYTKHPATFKQFCSFYHTLHLKRLNRNVLQTAVNSECCKDPRTLLTYILTIMKPSLKHLKRLIRLAGNIYIYTILYQQVLNIRATNVMNSKIANKVLSHKTVNIHFYSFISTPNYDNLFSNLK